MFFWALLRSVAKFCNSLNFRQIVPLSTNGRACARGSFASFSFAVERRDSTASPFYGPEGFSFAETAGGASAGSGFCSQTRT
jgi:hypothetical protein